jgi:Cell division protein ZapA
MNDLIAISALIGDRTYRIKINPADEEVVRKTLKIINDKIVEFKTMFAGKDMQDYIAMVLIWFATEQHAGAASGIANDHLSEKLSLLESLLDGQLKPS